MIHAHRLTREPIEITISLDALDELEEAMPTAARYTDPTDTRPHLLVWAPGITLKVIGDG